MSFTCQPKSRSRLTLSRHDHPRIPFRDLSEITHYDRPSSAPREYSKGDHRQGPKPVSFEVAPDSRLQPDCPLCHLLCLSPTVLPCGHLICRKCVRRILEDAANMANTAIFASFAESDITANTASSDNTSMSASSASTAIFASSTSTANSANTLFANTVNTAKSGFTANTGFKAFASKLASTFNTAKCANTAIHGSVGTFRSVGTAACPFCGCEIPRAEEQTVTEVADGLGKDVVMEDVVLEVLIQQGEVLCTVCSHKPAVTLCLDCRETYCQDCCVSHKRMAATGDHLLENLARLRHRPPMSLRGRIPCVVCPDRIARSLCITCRETYCAACSRAHKNMRVTQGHFQEDLSKLFQTPSSSSLSSDTSVGDQKHLRRDLKREAERLKKGLFRLEEALSIIRADVAQLKRVENTLEQKQQLLALYVSRLKEPDKELLCNAKAAMIRLKRLTQECHPPPEAALISLTRQVIGVLHLVTETGALGFDPMSDSPTETFSLDPVTENDTYQDGSLITSIVVTRGAKLVMADFRNKSIKVADLNNPDKTVLGVSLDTEPGRLALLWDGQVAVAAAGNRIYFVDVIGTPTVTSHVPTRRNYQGISSLVLENKLLASCQQDEDGPAGIDILSQTGVLLKTVVSSRTLSVLSAPLDLCLLNQTVWVADWNADAVFKLDLETGTVLNTYTHPDLSGPAQVVCDSMGNCYMVSCSGRCVLVISSNGMWRRLLPVSKNLFLETSGSFGHSHLPVSENVEMNTERLHSVLPVSENLVRNPGTSRRQTLLPVSQNLFDTDDHSFQPLSKTVCLETGGSQLDTGATQHPNRGYPRAMCVTDSGLVVAWDGCTKDGSGPGSVIVSYKLV